MALTDNLISFWELEEASGTRNDAHSTNHLTDNNTVGQAAGKVGNAAAFVTANEEYLSVASNAALQTGDIDYTLCAWVYLDTKAHWQIVLTRDGNGSPAGSREYHLAYNQFSDRFEFYVFRATDSAVGVVANNLGSPSTATWYFIVASHDAAADTSYIQVNNGTADSAATGGALQAASSEPFRIGADNSPAGDALDGRVDQVGFWKRLLTADEKTFLYNGGNGRSYGEIAIKQRRSLGLRVGTRTH